MVDDKRKAADKHTAGKHRTFTARGPLTDATIVKLMAVMREADDEQPEALFGVGVIDTDGSTEEGDRLLREILPSLEQRVTLMFRRRKFDG